MYYIKKRSTLVTFSMLLLISSAPTKSEPVTTVLIGSACLAGGAAIGYLCSEINKATPPVEVVTIQSKHFREAINEKYAQLASLPENELRRTLIKQFSNTQQVKQKSDDIEASQDAINKKIEEIEKIICAHKELSPEQRTKILEEKQELYSAQKKLKHLFNAFNKNKTYFELQATLHEVQSKSHLSHGMFSILDEEKNLKSKQKKAISVQLQANRLKFQDIALQAEEVSYALHRAINKLQQTEAYKREHAAKLEYDSRIKCQELYNKELERQADLDRKIRRQEIATERQKNALKQQELDLAEGFVEQRIAMKFREQLNKVKDQLEKEQSRLSETKQALGHSLSRETSLKKRIDALSKNNNEKACMIALLKEQLKKAQTGEREKYNQCNAEGCNREHCPIHLEPSAPPAPNAQVSTDGPPQSAYGFTRK